MPSPSPVPETLSQSPSRARSRSTAQKSVSMHDRRPSQSRDRSRSRSRSYSRSQSRSRSRSRTRDRSRSRTHSSTSSSSRPLSSKIVIEHLTRNVYRPHLHEIFSSYGEIESLDLPLNRHFMTNKGIAYILYTQPSYARAAIAHMHEAQLDGAVISVSTVLPRRRASPSPSPPRRPAGRYADSYWDGPSAHRTRDHEDSYRPAASQESWRGRGGAPRRGGRGRYRNGTDDRNMYQSGPGPRHGYTSSRNRSRSPTRSRSYSSRSRSRSRSVGSPPPSRYSRRRSPSYSSYGSRSRSRNRDRAGERERG